MEGIGDTGFGNDDFVGFISNICKATFGGDFGMDGRGCRTAAFAL